MRLFRSFFHREPESDVERLIALWRRRDFQACNQMLQSQPLLPEMGKALKYILHNPFPASRLFQRQAEYCATRALVLGCLWQYDPELVITTLIPLLCDSDEEIYKTAYIRLKEYGEEAIPYIDKQLAGTLDTFPSRLGWDGEGVFRCLRLLGETRSPKAIAILRTAHYRKPFLGTDFDLKPKLFLSSLLPLLVSLIRLLGDTSWERIVIEGVLGWAICFMCLYVVVGSWKGFVDHIDHENTYKPAAWKAMIQILDKAALSHVLGIGAMYAPRLTTKSANLLAEQIKLLETEEKGTLTGVQMRALYAFLIPEYSALCQSTLLALTRVGSAESLPRIRRLQSKKMPPEIQEVANYAYERLRIRLETEQENKELLRASHFQEDPQILLRPSQESSEPQEQLLRPSKHDD